MLDLKHLVNRTIYILGEAYAEFKRRAVLKWYRKLDEKIAELVIDTGFVEEGQNKLIVISDRGFCSFGEAQIQTLPQKREWGELKADHHENSLLVTVNLHYEIERPQDVFFAIKKSLR